MCWLAISPPLKGEDTKFAEGCPGRWPRTCRQPFEVVVVVVVVVVVAAAVVVVRILLL